MSEPDLPEMNWLNVAWYLNAEVERLHMVAGSQADPVMVSEARQRSSIALMLSKAILAGLKSD